MCARTHTHTHTHTHTINAHLTSHAQHKRTTPLSSHSLSPCRRYGHNRGSWCVSSLEDASFNGGAPPPPPPPPLLLTAAAPPPPPLPPTADARLSAGTSTLPCAGRSGGGAWEYKWDSSCTTLAMAGDSSSNSARRDQRRVRIVWALVGPRARSSEATGTRASAEAARTSSSGSCVCVGCGVWVLVNG